MSNYTLEEYVVHHDYTLFYDEDSKFTIARYKVGRGTDQVPTGTILVAKGIQLPTRKKYRIILKGELVQEPMHKGYSYLKVHESRVDLPSSKDLTIACLSSLGVGIGKKTARLIYEEFGENTWYIIENSPESLLSIKGISKRRVKRLKAMLEVYPTIAKMLKEAPRSKV